MDAAGAALFPLSIQFKGQTINLSITEEEDVETLRFRLFGLTRVMPHRQKIFGLPKVFQESDLLVSLGVGVKTKKLQLVGNAEEDMVVFDATLAQAGTCDMADDDNINPDDLAPEEREENQKKVSAASYMWCALLMHGISSWSFALPAAKWKS